MTRAPLSHLAVAVKSGFLTKELFSEFFFKGQTRQGRNKAWGALRKRGHFMPHRNERLRGVLVPNPRNREVKKKHGHVAPSPFEGQLKHDEILLRGLLLADQSGMLEQWITEAELKAMGQDRFRIEVEGKKIKYPDALLYVSDRNGAFHRLAVELELTQKTRKRYRQIIGSYSVMKGVSDILFVVASPAIEEALRSIEKSDFYGKGGRRIGFMRVEGWLKNPIFGDIDFGNERITLGHWLSERDGSL